MAARECPCNNCERKGCGAYHSSCPEYQNFKNECFEYKQAINKAKAPYCITASYIHERVKTIGQR